MREAEAGGGSLRKERDESRGRAIVEDRRNYAGAFNPPGVYNFLIKRTDINQFDRVIGARVLQSALL